MQQMNGIAVRVDRIKGRCRCDITGTVNYWVLLERWTRSQIRGTSPLHMHEPTYIDLSPVFTFLSSKTPHDILSIATDVAKIVDFR